MTDRALLTYSDALLRRILADTRIIAMVGASTNWNRPSYFVMKYLQAKGYRVIPVNPAAAGQQILGETVRASLSEITEKVDMVDVFRRSDQVGPVADEAVAIGAKVLWLQIGVINEAARRLAEEAGLTVVMDRCVKIEYARLFGGLNWFGVNTRVISSRRPNWVAH